MSFEGNYYNTILSLYSERHKIWRWGEIESKTDLPSEFISAYIGASVIDPSWAQTQSAKHRFAYPPQMYTHADFYQLKFDLIQGIGSRHTYRGRYQQARAYNRTAIDLNNHFKTIETISRLPHIRSIHVIGSHALGVGSAHSDLDLMVCTDPGWVYTVRAFIKIYLKLTGKDVHKLIWEVNIGRRSLSQSHQDVQRQELKSYGKSVDIAIICDDLTIANTWFESGNPRQVWLTKAKKVFERDGGSDYGDLKIRTRTSWALRVIAYVCKPYVDVISKAWYGSKPNKNSNYIAQDTMISYVPRWYHRVDEFAVDTAQFAHMPKSTGIE